MRNWLKYLGLLGMVGILGFFTSNPGFYGFFGFFGFFGFRDQMVDERLHNNANLAGRNAFIISLIVFAAANVIATIISNPVIYIYAFSIGFGLQMLTFAVSISISER